MEKICSRAFEYTAFFDNEANWENGVLYCEKHLLAVKEDYAGRLEIRPGTRLIADFAANRCKSLTEVTIPDSLVILGEGAFNICSALENVTIPASVTTLHGSTFRFCDSLVSVTIPETATTIEEDAFRECDSLETIVLPDGLEVIVKQGFAWSSKLTDINLPESLTTIGDRAFVSTNINNIYILKNDSSIGGNAPLNTATIHFNHVHTHSLDADSEEIYNEYGCRLYSCICGHYYAEYDLFSKSDKYDVTAIYSPDCFNEEITLDVEAVTGDREPGGIYMVDGKTYIQVGVYNLKAVNENGEVVQPNEGQTVKIKIAIPEEYKNKTDMIIYHRFVDGGREKLSTSDGTLLIQNGYMIFEVNKFSEFEILAGTAEMTVSKLPDKLNYCYKGAFDLGGIQLKITDIDGSVEYITDTSKMTVEGFDSTKLGTQTVTVRYEQYSCTFEVTVSYAWWQWIIRILLFGFLWY